MEKRVLRRLPRNLPNDSHTPPMNPALKNPIFNYGDMSLAIRDIVKDSVNIVLIYSNDDVMLYR